MKTTDTALSIRDLTKRFGAKTAVNQLNVSVDRGEIFGLVGPNGAGKSTTMRMLVDALRPTSGSIRVLGQNPRDNTALRRHIGYLPGEFLTVPSLTGKGLLKHFAALNPVADSAYHDSLIRRLGAELNRPISKLSKGNKQKIGLIQAFMHQPDLLILDEPTSGLDPLVQQVFLELLLEAAGRGQTVFLSSHILSEIQHAAHRVGVVKDGSLLALASVAELRDAAGQQMHASLEGLVADQLRSQLARQLPASALTAREEGNRTLVRGTLRDPVPALLSLLGTYTVQELNLEKPDLEESILHYYQDGTSTDTPAGSVTAHKRGSHAL